MKPDSNKRSFRDERDLNKSNDRAFSSMEHEAEDR
jgi:hypothetical protein